MLAPIAALLFLIAFTVEIVHDTTLDTLLIAGFLLVALYLAGIGARTWEPRPWGTGA
jgi:hypothetical protein